MILRKKIISFIIFFLILVGTAYGFVSATRHFTSATAAELQQPQPRKTTPAAVKDSATRFPVSNQAIETYEDLSKVYPMDLRNPENIKTEIEYDVNTGNYVIRTKAGELEISTPMTLSPEEYNRYSLRKSMLEFYRDRNVRVWKATKINSQRPI